jgi:hypothetical protein|tara:strand:+ start:1923 stop:2150 length:228 start_codon:yes stop_codon:yes gene_type:complete
MSDYEWFNTPYGDFRLELKPHKTWTSYDREGNALVTGLDKVICYNGTTFYLEGRATNWANSTGSSKFEGVVGGKL